MDFCGLTSTISPSPFKLAFRSLIMSGQQLHACSDALLPFLYCAMASGILHTSSQLLIDFKTFSSTLQKNQLFGGFSTFTPLYHFTRPAICSIFTWPSLAIPSWCLPISLPAGGFSTFQLHEFSAPAFYHVGLCPSFLCHAWVHVWICLKLHVDTKWVENLNILWFFFKFLDLLGILTFLALLTLKDVKNRFRGWFLSAGVIYACTDAFVLVRSGTYHSFSF